MSSPLDFFFAGRQIVSTRVEGQAIVVTLSGVGEGPQDEAFWRQPLGIRSRPIGGTCDTFVSQDGDYPEVVLGWAPDLELPPIAEGAMQIYSCGPLPQIIEIADDHINVGKNAIHMALLGTLYNESEGAMNKVMITNLTDLVALMKRMLPISPVPAEPNSMDALKQATLFAGMFQGIYVVLDRLSIMMTQWLAQLNTFEGLRATFVSKVVKIE